jgi:hypothetical protein
MGTCAGISDPEEILDYEPRGKSAEFGRFMKVWDSRKSHTDRKADER